MPITLKLKKMKKIYILLAMNQKATTVATPSKNQPISKGKTYYIRKKTNKEMRAEGTRLTLYSKLV